MARHKDLTGAEAVHPAAYVASSDPGAVGAHKLWVDTTSGPPFALNKRNAANSAWEAVGSSGGVSDAELLAIAGLTSAANKLPYFTGSGTASLTDLTSFGRSLIDDADAASARSTLVALMGVTPTAVKTAGYTAAAGDLVPVDTTSGAVTITLPAAPADGTVIAVKMVIKGGSNATTIARGGSDVFNKAGGSTSLQLDRALQAVFLLYKSSSAIWYVVAADMALVVGTDVQAYDAELAALAGLTSAADSFPYFTSSGTASLLVITSAIRTVLAASTVSAFITALASTSSALGVGTIDLGHASDTTFSRIAAGRAQIESKEIYTAGGTTDVAVADGGTGSSSAGVAGALVNLGIVTATADSGTLTAGSAADLTITWPATLPNTNYKIFVSFMYPASETTNRTPPSGYVKRDTGNAPTTTTCKVRVINNAAVSEVVTVVAMAVLD